MAEIGTYIGEKELWEKGYGHQITVALLEVIFNQLNIDRCAASSVEYNVRAHKVLESCGFKKSEVIKQSFREWTQMGPDLFRHSQRRISENTSQFIKKGTWRQT